jgi:hypothetical protein
MLHLTTYFSWCVDNWTESEVVTGISPDDGLGWIKVETAVNHIGLVPATYVEMVPGPAATAAPQARAPSSQPKPIPARLRRGACFLPPKKWQDPTLAS